MNWIRPLTQTSLIIVEHKVSPLQAKQVAPFLYLLRHHLQVRRVHRIVLRADRRVADLSDVNGIQRRIEYSRCSVRINNRSPTIAGDACAISSNVFTCNNWNFSPAAITNVWPSSLRQNSLPL